MRLTTIVLAGSLAAAVVMGRSRLIAQQPSCLHGPNESDAQRARTRAALTMARQINTLENRVFQVGGEYAPIRELVGLSTPPEGFEVRAAVESRNYAVAIKDTADACGFAYFSDQDGIIYTGEPIR